MNRRTIGARITLLATNEGGRSELLLSGYRTLLRFKGTKADFGVEMELDQDIKENGLAPGESCNARLSMWAVEDVPALAVGQEFEIREGHRVVGHGKVTEV